MRRIALYSDIHANALALDAVYDDMRSAGVAERYCLGDLIGYGPDPAGVIERVRVSGDPTIQGNYDEGVASRRGSCGCYYATDADKVNGAASYDFTDSALSPDDAEWLLGLPEHIPLAEGDARILLVHGSPRKINEYLLLDRTERQLARLAAEAGADAVCHGHTHIPYHRSFVAEDTARTPAVAGPGASAGAREGATVHYVSSGSVGKPKDGDPRACWVELVLGSEGDVRAAAPGDGAAGPLGPSDVWLGVVVHRAAYDVEAVARAMVERGLPERLAEALRRA